MADKLEGRVAIITGASIGIGKATALKMSALGAKVVLVDLDENGLTACAEECRALGAEVLTFTADVSDEARAVEIVDKTVEYFGKLDILVNNAGIWRRFMLFRDSNSDLWKQYLNVNLMGTMYYTHAALKYMLDAGYGRVINIASVAGVYGNARMVEYSTSKAAVIGFTKALAKEVAENGITVNAVSPGSVSNHQDEIEPSDLPYMGRTGTHTENANMICFLASEEASYVSGQNIQVDGCRRRI